MFLQPSCLPCASFGPKPHLLRWTKDVLSTFTSAYAFGNAWKMLGERGRHNKMTSYTLSPSVSQCRLRTEVWGRTSTCRIKRPPTAGPRPAGSRKRISRARQEPSRRLNVTTFSFTPSFSVSYRHKMGERQRVEGGKGLYTAAGFQTSFSCEQANQSINVMVGRYAFDATSLPRGLATCLPLWAMQIK